MTDDPAPAPSPVSHCSQGGSRVLAADDDKNDHQHPRRASSIHDNDNDHRNDNGNGNEVTTEHDPGPSPLVRPPYDDAGHQRQHPTPHTDDGGPAFNGTYENHNSTRHYNKGKLREGH